MTRPIPWITLLSLPLLACNVSAVDPLAAEDELKLSAVGGPEEELLVARGGLAGEPGAKSGEVDEPPLFRACHIAEHHEEIWDRYDANDDGVLDREDREAVWSAREHRTDDHRRHRARVWRHLAGLYDADCSRSLEESEWQALVADFDQRCGVLQARLLDEFDVDGDGQLDEVEEQAAREALEAQREAEHQERLAEYDTNGNGRIDGDERPGMECENEDHLHRRQGERPMEHCGEPEFEAAREAMKERIRQGDPMQQH